MRIRSIVLLSVVGLLGAACGGSNEETASDTWGLDGITAPTTQEEVNVIFLAMPEEIDGMSVYRDDPEHVGFVDYTSDDSAASVTWSQVGSDDRATTIEQLEQIANSDQFTELESNLSDDTATVLLYGTVADPDVHQILYWGDPSDGWLFMFDADSAEHMDALVTSFISAADGS